MNRSLLAVASALALMVTPVLADPAPLIDTRPVPAEPRASKTKKAPMLFGSKDEVIFAYTEGDVKTHDRIIIANPDLGKKTEYGSADKKTIETTVGRVVFSEIWPEGMGFPNIVVNKGKIGELIWRCYKACGHEKTIEALDRLKELGFREATKAGVSIGIDDALQPVGLHHPVLRLLAEEGGHRGEAFLDGVVGEIRVEPAVVVDADVVPAPFQRRHTSQLVKGSL